MVKNKYFFLLYLEAYNFKNLSTSILYFKHVPCVDSFKLVSFLNYISIYVCFKIKILLDINIKIIYLYIYTYIHIYHISFIANMNLNSFK